MKITIQCPNEPKDLNRLDDIAAHLNKLLGSDLYYVNKNSFNSDINFKSFSNVKYQKLFAIVILIMTDIRESLNANGYDNTYVGMYDTPYLHFHDTIAQQMFYEKIKQIENLDDVKISIV